jgi:ergothioneine biosynthesis protein EgtB
VVSVGASLEDRYRAVRRMTEDLCRPLSPEDCGVQSMPDASPAKWHLAHTAWFFETFLLSTSPGYQAFHPAFRALFNSYYNGVGDRHARPSRGLLSRPSIDEVFAYRRHVDQAMLRLIDDQEFRARSGSLITLGLHHEQQHQELILTDIKHAFGLNPLRPAYTPPPSREESIFSQEPAPLSWRERPGGIVDIGAPGADESGQPFSFDNEGPRHAALLRPHRIGSRLVTSGEYQIFMGDGGYRRPELWLSDGWEAVQAGGWVAPLYWETREARWWSMTFAGMRPVASAEPVAHVSYYEADAYARWSGARLPTEDEWEAAASSTASASTASAVDERNLLESGWLRPTPASASIASVSDGIAQLFGDVWEWTQSPYTPYPGFRAAAGAVGEYNGKFMCNQMVLRGGSCLTPRSHIRASYRNFFAPAARWQMSGLRLARDS